MPNHNPFVPNIESCEIRAGRLVESQKTPLPTHHRGAIKFCGNGNEQLGWEVSRDGSMQGMVQSCSIAPTNDQHRSMAMEFYPQIEFSARTTKADRGDVTAGAAYQLERPSHERVTRCERIVTSHPCVRMAPRSQQLNRATRRR